MKPARTAPATLLATAVVTALLVAACSGDEVDSTGAAGPAGEGRALYLANCSACHADDGSGATGPAVGDGVTAGAYTVEETVAIVRDGRSGMPAYGDQLTTAEIASVVEYVRDDLGRSAGGDGVVSEAAGARGTYRALGVAPEVIEFADGWPLPNRDLAASRAVPDSPIDSRTVDDLEVVWRYEVSGGSLFGNLATTPLILGDGLFLQGLDGVVHALDAASGERRWTAGDEGTMFGPSGVAVGWGKVYAVKVGPTGRGRYVAAYDIDDGTELWATDITVEAGPAGLADVNIQPLAHDGLVLAATSGFPAGVRGTITALDHETGGLVWSFATVESEDLWGNPGLNSGGGAWYPPAVDVASNSLFFGVGNPYPFPAAATRPGDNRWTSGTVALDAATGELRWGFQAFPHDRFDRDHVLAALADDVLVTAGKGGVVIALDAVTGDELWSTPVGEHLNDDVTSFDGPLEVLPGAQGGVVTPIAVADGTAYVAAVNAPIVYESDTQNSDGFATQLFTRPSNLVALDVGDGSIVWDVEVSPDVLGGMTVVNDLVFTATLAGEILALARADGEIVWRHRADGGINGWPAVADDLIVFPVGLAEPPHLLALRLPA